MAGVARAANPSDADAIARIYSAGIAERVATFKQKETAKCREALLSTAEHIVDSLLLSEALLGVSDSLARSRPVKPVKPQAVPTIDSSPVEPLFKH